MNSVSEAVRNVALDADLGAFVRMHDQSAGRHRRFWVISILGLAAAGLFLALGVGAIVAGSGGAQPELLWVATVPIGIGLLVVILFVLSLRRMLGTGQFSQRAYLHESGLVLRRADRHDAYRWDAITKTRRVIRYRKGIEAGRTYSWTGAGGDRVELSQFLDDYVGLGETILERTAAQLVPTYLSEVDAGLVVDFGSVRVDEDGFSIGTDRFGWDDVTSSEFQGEQTLIFRVGSKRLARLIELRHVNDPAAFITIWNHQLREARQ